MNFFSRQELARRRTFFLLFYFVLCVLAIIAAVYAACSFFFFFFDNKLTSLSNTWGDTATYFWWDPKLFFTVSAGTVFVILAGSLYKIHVLSQGGSSVAAMLGGRLVNANTNDIHERTLLNVVEEMAIASGTPVPPVYILDKEQGINAFAAGVSPGNAVVGVTRACVDLLSRDELQGVIAHEFSHILSGDMRLNLRLMGVLNGILVLSIIGRILLQFRSSSSFPGRKKSGNPLPLLGMALMVIGLIGVFFGKLIKAAVSRQREFLADASAVQFTRNPPGLAGALRKISGLQAGSRIRHEHAEEASHFYFSNGLQQSFLNLMATHPPLEKRIKLLEPSFDGSVSKFVSESSVAEKVLSNVGAPQMEHLLFASSVLASLPRDVEASVREPFSARAVIFSLLLDERQELQDLQLKQLQLDESAALAEETLKLAPEVRQLGRKYYLPLLEIALPALRALSKQQYETFRKNIHFFVHADKQVDLFEFVVEKMLQQHLDFFFGTQKKEKMVNRPLGSFAHECAGFLSVLAHFGNENLQNVQKAFEAGRAAFQLQGVAIECMEKEKASLSVLDEALKKFSCALPAVKQAVLKAAAACILADKHISIEEAELIRAIADTLECPIPPLVLQ